MNKENRNSEQRTSRAEHRTVCIVRCSTFALALLLAGCQTPYQFPNATAHWQNETGQLQYSNPQRSIIGGAEVSTLDAHEFQFDFSAGPGFPIMKLRQSGELARAEVAFAHVSWQGNVHRVPHQLKSWLALREIFYQLEFQHFSTSQITLNSQSPGFWKADATLLGGRPKDLTVHFPHSKERFVFHFDR